MNARCRVAIAFLVVCACSAPDGETSEEAAAGAVEQRYTAADFQALRYLEGDWRGSGYEGGPFYESYRFVNDSTIEMIAWTDSTMTAARERSQYTLRNGVIGNDDGARLVRVDENGHHFEAESHGWTFRRVSADQWTARTGPSTIYTMDRIIGRPAKGEPAGYHSP